jgi:DNA polymerase I
MLFGDTETFLIAPGAAAPPMVTFQYALDDEAPSAFHVRDSRTKAVIERALHEHEWSFQNLAFDACVLCAQYPDLTPAVFAAYNADRMSCTIMDARLVAIAEGEFQRLTKKKGAWALDGLSERFKTGVVVDKGDVWRLKYGTLINTPLEQFPPEATHYMLMDCTAQRALRRAIDTYAASKGVPLVDRYRQARAAFWLRLMECRGIAVDRDQVERYIAEVEQEIAAAKEVILRAGLLRANGTKDMKAARAWMVKCCAEVGVEAPKTETGDIALDKDALSLYGDETLDAYQTFTSASTLRKRVAGLRTDVCIQSAFEPLVDTGRTSCRMGSLHGAQLQNPPSKGSFRHCFRPRPGFYFSSVDYASMELCVFSQNAIWLTGHSRMGEIINAGGDVNTVTGAAFAGIPEEQGYARRKGVDGPELKKEFDSRHRALGKVFNYGGLGAMGSAKLALSARKQFKITLTDAEAKRYLQIWKRTYPEIPRVFEYANKLLNGRETASLIHPWSGRKRGGMYYTQVCSSQLQPTAADIAKLACWRIAEECYVVKSSPLFGSRAVNFLHDETFLEVPIECAHEAAHRQAQIMIEAAQEVCPDITFGAEPALMALRWDKGAATKYDENKRLVPWDL